ncbi:hypothetical protein HYQ46_009578 [Verticillium longisporum]|nr:hypothetical protein HYQ46_009578 [Verticillium longisporum]
MTTSPLTPRPSTAPHAQQRPDTIPEDAATPTRASFAGNALASQKPLPSSPFPDAVQIPESADGSVPTRENSRHSRKSRDSEDVDMDDSDGDTAAGDEGISDDDSVNGDGSRSGKKKKSQRFYSLGPTHQETYWRETIPVPLLKAFLSAGQPSTARSDCSRQ